MDRGGGVLKELRDEVPVQLAGGQLQQSSDGLLGPADRHRVAGDSTRGLRQRKCPEWWEGILRAGPLPCRGGQPTSWPGECLAAGLGVLAEHPASLLGGQLAAGVVVFMTLMQSIFLEGK